MSETKDQLYFQIIQLKDRIAELEAELAKTKLEIALCKPVSFLPECKWQRNANNVTYCTDTGCKLFDQPCSKRCDCPEPTSGEEAGK
jgi:hypothetical protein